jgi:hypothetical protein
MYITSQSLIPPILDIFSLPFLSCHSFPTHTGNATSGDSFRSLKGRNFALACDQGFNGKGIPLEIANPSLGFNENGGCRPPV